MKTITLTPANAQLFAQLNEIAQTTIADTLDTAVINDQVVSITLEQLQLPYNDAIDYRCQYITVLTEDEAEHEEEVFYNPAALIRAFKLDEVEA